MQKNTDPFFQKKSEQTAFTCTVCEQAASTLIRLSCNHIYCFICTLKQILDIDSYESISFEHVTCQACGVETEFLKEVQNSLMDFFEELDSELEKEVSVIEEVEEDNEESMIEKNGSEIQGDGGFKGIIDSKDRLSIKRSENDVQEQIPIDNCGFTCKQDQVSDLNLDLEGIKEKEEKTVFEETETDNNSGGLGIRMIESVRDIDKFNVNLDFDKFRNIEKKLSDHFANSEDNQDNRSIRVDEDERPTEKIKAERPKEQEKPKLKKKTKSKKNKSTKKMLKGVLKKDKDNTKKEKVKTKRKSKDDRISSFLQNESFTTDINQLCKKFNNQSQNISLYCEDHNETAIYYNPFSFTLYCPNCILNNNINPNKDLKIIKNSFSFILNQFSQITNDYQTKWNIFLAKEKEYVTSKKYLKNKIKSLKDSTELFFDNIMDFCKREKDRMMGFFNEIKDNFNEKISFSDDDVSTGKSDFKKLFNEINSVLDSTENVNDFLNYFFKNAVKLKNQCYLKKFSKASTNLENSLLDLGKQASDKINDSTKKIFHIIQNELKQNQESIENDFKQLKNTKSKKLFDILRSKFSNKETLEDTLTLNNIKQQNQLRNLLKRSYHNTSSKNKVSFASNIYNKDFFDQTDPVYTESRNKLTDSRSETNFNLNQRKNGNTSINKRSLIDYQKIFEKKRSNGDTRFLLGNKTNSEQVLFKTENDFSDRYIHRTGYLRNKFKNDRKESSLDKKNSLRYFNSNKTLEYKPDVSRELDNVQRKIDIFKERMRDNRSKGHESVDIYGRKFEDNFEGY